MFRSLRFRLPALFLAAIVLAGLLSTAVAVSVSKRYAQTTLRKEAFRQLGREAGGINQIYTKHAGGNPPDSRELESASGDQIYYVRRAKGIDLFPGSPTPAFTLLPRSILDFRRILSWRHQDIDDEHARTSPFVGTGADLNRDLLVLHELFIQT